MYWRISFLAVFLALPLFSEPAQIMYYNFFGDYLTEDAYEIDVDVENLSLAEIKSILDDMRRSRFAMNSNLVIIGYGEKGAPEDFFAATPLVTYEIPLHMALNRVPESKPNAKWFIYFVDASLSNYVRARKDLHWASPFRWLAQIGLQNLYYFGPF